jgi:hypothetical protein
MWTEERHNQELEWDCRKQWPEEELFCESRWQEQIQRSIGGSTIGNRCKKVNKN